MTPAAVKLERRQAQPGPAASLIAAVAVAASSRFKPLAAGIDLQELLDDVAETLGDWTYLLVGLLAFLETGAFVGLVAPGETSVILGGAVAGPGGRRRSC